MAGAMWVQGEKKEEKKEEPVTQSNHVKRKLKQRNQSRKLDEVRLFKQTRAAACGDEPVADRACSAFVEGAGPRPSASWPTCQGSWGVLVP